jgi:hypothetical protein
MKARHLVWVVVMGSLALSGAAMAEDDMGKGTGMMGDGDAKVTKAEFLKRAETRFAHMDANKDGVIDASDRKKMHEHMRECMNMMEGTGMMGGGMKGGMGGQIDGMGKPEDDHSAHHPAP